MILIPLSHLLSFHPMITRAVLIIALVIVAGCAEYQVTIPDSHPADINYQGATMKAWLWGTMYDPGVLAAECRPEGINDVVISRTYWHDLASVFSFGIFRPLEVKFRCESADLVEGDSSDFAIPNPDE